LRFRDGSDVQQIIEENEILNRYRSNIEVVYPGIVNGLSSTYVRQLLMKKQSIKYLVPEELRKYLEENEIYTAESQNTNKDTVLAPLQLYNSK
jgi:nicotinic acid mononucleotide adenylyltransferase